LGILLGFVRWGIFLRVVGITVSPWQIFRMGAVGLFFNHFLPGAIGGDAVKIGWLAARGASAKDALLSVLMDRISGIGALILCSVVFIGLRFEWLMQSPVVAAMNHLVIGYLVVVIALLAFSFVISAKGAVAKIPKNLPGRATIVEFSSTYSLFVEKWPMTLAASGISVLLLMAYFLTFYFCALALGGHGSTSGFSGLHAGGGPDCGPANQPWRLWCPGGSFCGPARRTVQNSCRPGSVRFFCRRCDSPVVGMRGALLVAGIQTQTMTNFHEARRVAAGHFPKTNSLYYYTHGKIALDPVYPWVAKALAYSKLPLLDVGCGAGQLAAFLRACGHSAPILGVDVDANKIAQASAAIPTCTFQVGDARELPVHCGDVVMLDVLHYF
jgi:hypothetical protein